MEYFGYYEVKDAYRNYWWINAREAERNHDDKNDPEYYTTSWVFTITTLRPSSWASATISASTAL